MRASYEHNETDNFEGVHLLDDGGNQVSVLRALRFDEQDRELGQDTYAIVQTGGATVYGGIDEWARDDDDHAWMYLTEQAQEILDSAYDCYEWILTPAEMDVVHACITRFVTEAGGKAFDDRASRGDA